MRGADESFSRTPKNSEATRRNMFTYSENETRNYSFPRAQFSSDSVLDIVTAFPIATPKKKARRWSSETPRCVRRGWNMSICNEMSIGKLGIELNKHLHIGMVSCCLYRIRLTAISSTSPPWKCIASNKYSLDSDIMWKCSSHNFDDVEKLLPWLHRLRLIDFRVVKIDNNKLSLFEAEDESDERITDEYFIVFLPVGWVFSLSSFMLFHYAMEVKLTIVYWIYSALLATAGR